MKYVSVSDGQWMRPIRRGWRLRCCDCKLVHVINFRIRKGRIEFQAFRQRKR